MADYLPRLVDPLLKEIHDGFAAVQVVGPRSCGKTTSAARLAAQIDRLDEPGTAAVYRLDPDAALRRAQRPLLIDEFQLVPEVQAAVKRAVDRDRTPGQFILTGSARAGLDLDFAPATGRIVSLHMQGLTERELEGRPDEGFLQRVVRNGLDDLRVPPTPPDIDEYLARALRSGFPEPALGLASAALRQRWLTAYVEQVVTRDAALLAEGRNPAKLSRYLEVLALQTAGTPTNSTLYAAAGIDKRTAAGYDGLLNRLFLTEQVAPWPRTGNRLTALAKLRKRYVLDAGIAVAAARLTVEDVLSDADLVGRMFDTFATAQLRAEATLTEPAPRMHHLRTSKGDVEVDLVFDLGRGRAVAMEFKAAAKVDRKDAKHLFALRDDLGTDFLAGVVLYSGTHLVELGDRVYGVPLCCLWS